MPTNSTRLTLSALAATFIFATSLCAQDATAPKLPPPSTRTGLTYATDLKSVFDANCVKCHSGDRPKAHLKLDSLEGILAGTKRGPALKPGDGANSLMVMAVAHQLKDPDQWMPPMPNKADAKTLTPEQIGLVMAWINQGAK